MPLAFRHFRYLYLVGAFFLVFNLFSGISIHLVYAGAAGCSQAMAIYSFMMMWFILEYTFFEHVHLYTSVF